MNRVARATLPLSSPPTQGNPVDPLTASRSTNVDRILTLRRQAIEDCRWKHLALARHMNIDPAHLSRLLNGEKPWNDELTAKLPDDIQSCFEQLRAEDFGLLVVTPVFGEAAVKSILGGIAGLLFARLPLRKRMAKAGLR